MDSQLRIIFVSSITIKPITIMNVQQIRFEKLTAKDVAEEIKNSRAYAAAFTATIVNHTHGRRRTILERAGMETSEIAAGSGGIGTVRMRRNGDVWFQFACGHGRHNYAECVKIGRYREGIFKSAI